MPAAVSVCCDTRGSVLVERPGWARSVPTRTMYMRLKQGMSVAADSTSAGSSADNTLSFEPGWLECRKRKPSGGSTTKAKCAYNFAQSIRQALQLLNNCPVGGKSRLRATWQTAPTPTGPASRRQKPTSSHMANDAHQMMMSPRHSKSMDSRGSTGEFERFKMVVAHSKEWRSAHLSL